MKESRLEYIKNKYANAKNMREQSLAYGEAYRFLNHEDYKSFVEWQKLNYKKPNQSLKNSK